MQLPLAARGRGRGHAYSGDLYLDAPNKVNSVSLSEKGRSLYATFHDATILIRTTSPNHKDFVKLVAAADVCVESIRLENPLVGQVMHEYLHDVFVKQVVGTNRKLPSRYVTVAEFVTRYPTYTKLDFVRSAPSGCVTQG